MKSISTPKGKRGPGSIRGLGQVAALVAMGGLILFARSREASLGPARAWPPRFGPRTLNPPENPPDFQGRNKLFASSPGALSQPTVRNLPDSKQFNDRGPWLLRPELAVRAPELMLSESRARSFDRCLVPLKSMTIDPSFVVQAPEVDSRMIVPPAVMGLPVAPAKPRAPRP